MKKYLHRVSYCIFGVVGAIKNLVYSVAMGSASVPSKKFVHLYRR
jgi:hypothetical protein